MTFFDVCIPGLKMTVVAADGQYVEPVSVDEFRIGVAETYDVLVEPKDDRAYALFAQAIDRSGYARGTLTPDPSLTAEVPEMDPAPVLMHGDMGMSHGGHAGHDRGDVDHRHHNMASMDHSQNDMADMDHTQHYKSDGDMTFDPSRRAIGWCSVSKDWRLTGSRSTRLYSSVKADAPRCGLRPSTS